MPRVHHRFVGIRHQHGLNRRDQRVVVASGKVRSSDRPGKQGVAHKQLPPGLSLSPDREAHPTGTVPRRVHHFDHKIAERQALPGTVKRVGLRLGLHRQSKEQAVLRSGIVQEQVGLMQPHRHPKLGLCGADPGDVVDVRMCQQDHRDPHPLAGYRRQHLLHVVARIDQHGFPRVFAGHHEAVLEEGWSGRRPDVHNPIMTRADVEAAARRLRLARRTPLLPSAWLSERCRCQVWLKVEAVQPGGSFKIRGAEHALAQLKRHQPDVTTVVTASAGNHGVAMSIAAVALGYTLRVHVPHTSPDAKKRALVANGATLIEAEDYDAAEVGARADAAASGAPYISPYNHPDVIAGAGTAALEMLEDEPGLDAIVVPLGGGGLLAGVALVAVGHSRPVRVIGAEAEASPVFTAALSEGTITPVTVSPTLADGLAGNLEPGSSTFALVRDHVDAVALVAEDSIHTAMRSLVYRERLVAEGAGATAVAALLQGGLGLEGARVGVLLTGRNVDETVLRRILA